MARGRPRKSLDHHIATGAIYKNPKRFKGRLEVARAQANGISPPADFLRETPDSERRLEIWNDLIASAEGLALEEDKFLLEQLVYSIQATRSGYTKISIRKSVTEMLARWDDRIRRRRDAQPGGGRQSEDSSFGEFA